MSSTELRTQNSGPSILFVLAKSGQTAIWIVAELLEAAFRHLNATNNAISMEMAVASLLEVVNSNITNSAGNGVPTSQQ